MNKKVIIIGGVVVLGVLVYLWWKNKNTVVSTPGASVAPGTSPPLIGTSGTPVVSTITNPVTGSVSTSLLAADGTVEVPSALQSWVATMGPANQALFMKSLPNMTGAEIAGLTDIVLNAWGKGAQPTQAQVTLWNNWYTKYGFPAGGSFSNFTGRPKVNQYGKRTK